MTRYFVTGGAGFIGSHFVERLLSDAHTTSVIAYDDLSNSTTEWIEPLLKDPRLTFVEADILDTPELTAAMSEAGMTDRDVVVHLASSVDMRKGLSDSSFDLRQCANGTLSVLEAMREVGPRKVLFSSSSTVYGEPTVLPTPEHAGPYAPISLYGAGKLSAEALLSAFCHLYGFTAHAFRFGNVVGGRMNHGVIYDFIVKLTEDSSRLHILGDGKQRKNYFLVEECVEGILTTSEKLGEGFHVLNLGNPGTVTVDEIASVIIDEMGLQDVQITYEGGSRGWPGDVPVVEYDLSKLGGLGWTAEHGCAAAVRECARRLLAERGWTQP
ncbi:NAD-dependent epimerase/dehydratase family protein [Streptomyces caelestis]|uniref:CcbM n=1 Tax=Streptomyces caelestis TaxID=36816 RepID=E9JES4_9ACTN|nr:NAD-dependent epimerase/dehydratase family protein [Streptomyces caelestis]ADB92562.1 CcbM [Streptomyces caelestis]MBB5794803.1 UDP-glucose 4-epimerase [Streptomyces caelestis]GGW28098.1 UDP-glucose 4-epimerase [Streptomyces caelestis]